MTHYPHVEDYLDLLAGRAVNHLLEPAPFSMRLASYDLTVVQSMADHTMFGGALTDRQAQLVLKLISTYQRQFAHHGVGVETILANPQYRLPLRKINREKSLYLEDDKLQMAFPYDQKLISQLYTHRKTSVGSVQFDPKSKKWSLSLTEPNVNWAVTVGELYNFDIDPQVQQLFDKIVECGDAKYAIELTATEQGYTILNAANSLTDYITQQYGEISNQNLVNIIDMAPVLGYTVGDSIEIPLILQAFNQRITHLTPSLDNYHIDMIFEYAALVDRWPVCIFDPSAALTDLSFMERFDASEVVRFDHNGKTKTCDYNPETVKVVYARKIPKTWNKPVPLLVSTVAMMFGGKRMEWLQTAEKIIFYCAKLKDTKHNGNSQIDNQR